MVSIHKFKKIIFILRLTATNEDKFGFVNLLEEIDETSNETKSMNSFFNSTVKNNGKYADLIVLIQNYFSNYIF